MMYALVCYDVNTQDSDGRKRLRKIAKACEKHGQRVQNSVFEIWCDYGQFMQIKESILKAMDFKKDSVRFYHLHKNYSNRVEHYGVKESYDPHEDLLII